MYTICSYNIKRALFLSQHFDRLKKYFEKELTLKVHNIHNKFMINKYTIPIYGTLNILKSIRIINKNNLLFIVELSNMI